MRGVKVGGFLLRERHPTCMERLASAGRRMILEFAVAIGLLMLDLMGAV
jgi:hypothetical protein